MPCSLSSRSCRSDMSPMACLRWIRWSGWIRLAAALRGGELLRRRLHGLDDVLVAGAAAQVAGDAVADLLLARVRVLLEQPVGARHHAGRAVAALQAVLLVERLLQRVQHAALLEAFDGEHLGAVALHRQHRAGLDRHAVDVDRAGAAVRGLAADVRAGVREPLAQRVDQQFARLDRRPRRALPLSLKDTLCVFAMFVLLGSSCSGLGARACAACSARRVISPHIALL